MRFDGLGKDALVFKDLLYQTNARVGNSIGLSRWPVLGLLN